MGTRQSGTTVFEEYKKVILKMKKFYLLFMVVFLTASANAQYKVEKELSIKKESAPQPMQAFIDVHPFHKRIRWYKELSLKGLSYEAKTSYKNFFYSIEFDSTGILQDLERIVLFKNIEDSTREKIEDELSKEFKKIKIKKVQEQFEDNDEKLHQLIEGKRPTSDFDFKYEIVFRGKKGKETKYYEVLTTSTGTMIAISEIKNRPIYNLEF